MQKGSGRRMTIILALRLQPDKNTRKQCARSALSIRAYSNVSIGRKVGFGGPVIDLLKSGKQAPDALLKSVGDGHWHWGECGWAMRWQGDKVTGWLRAVTY